MRRAARLLVACAAACGGAAGPPRTSPPILQNAAPRPRPPPSPTPACIGRCLPAVDFVDTTGHAQPVAGKVVVVNFWATWVRPSQLELPRLSRAYDRYRDQGVVVVGIVTDAVDAADLAALAASAPVTYPIVRATPALLMAFDEPSALPTTFVYDRSGAEVAHHVGPLGDDELQTLLEPLVHSR